MRILGTILFVIGSLFLLDQSPVCAQEMPGHVKKAIGRLVGQWSCETTVDGEKVTWDLECRWSPDESSVIYSWSGTDIVTGKPNSGSGILGWDAVKQLVVELEIDSDGSTYRSTHHILENGEWRSPTKGSRSSMASLFTLSHTVSSSGHRTMNGMGRARTK